MSRPFRFKQFTITQNQSPMKVGTDGVLLGAWSGTGSPKTILDIGTGTGLIALMLAQRFPESSVVAIEPNSDAVSDASINFKNSPFAKRLDLQNIALAEFETESKFDLIVSNPPFFSNSLISNNTGRSEARHTDSLRPEELAKAIKFLPPNGVMAVIYPLDTYATFSLEMKKLGFTERRRIEVKSTPGKSYHRILGEFQIKSGGCERSELIIEKYGRHLYSEEYIRLTSEFYLFRN